LVTKKPSIPRGMEGRNMEVDWPLCQPFGIRAGFPSGVRKSCLSSLSINKVLLDALTRWSSPTPTAWSIEQEVSTNLVAYPLNNRNTGRSDSSGIDNNPGHSDNNPGHSDRVDIGENPGDLISARGGTICVPSENAGIGEKDNDRTFAARDNPDAHGGGRGDRTHHHSRSHAPYPGWLTPPWLRRLRIGIECLS